MSKKILFFILFLGFIPLTFLHAETIPVEETKPTILIMGDSLSAAYGIPAEKGWVQLLVQYLEAQRYETNVVNASISGETTQGGLTRLPALLEKHKPTVVVLELGANDGLRGQSLKQMQKNLAEMIEKSQQISVKVLLLGMKLPPNYGIYAERFQQIYHDLAKQYKLRLVPFFLADVVAEPDLMQEDGLHPTAKAQSKLFATVWAQLEHLYTIPD
jgi:acyl-CoA thioesterase-1